jgi:ribosome maturation protein Sdo1
MIESQVNKIKYSYNPETGHEKQAEEIIEHLKKVMPIKIEITILEINVPAKYAKATAPKLRAFGHITKEYFDNEGNLRVHLEVVGAGLDKVIIFLKKNTNGEAGYHTQKL